MLGHQLMPKIFSATMNNTPIQINEVQRASRQPIRVMVVDNHAMILWGLGKLINEHRPLMEVAAVASSVADAISRAQDLMPDVVLIKYEFVRANAQDPLLKVLKHAGCRTLLWTDDITLESVEISLRSGAHGLLTRKSRAEEIIKAIENAHRGELWFDREASGMALNTLREPKSQPRADSREVGLLTRRERKVLRAVLESKAKTNKDLARQLFISESTVRNHLSSIYQKMGVCSRLDLLVYAQERGLVNDLNEFPL